MGWWGYGLGDFWEQAMLFYIFLGVAAVGVGLLFVGFSSQPAARGVAAAPDLMTLGPGGSRVVLEVDPDKLHPPVVVVVFPHPLQPRMLLPARHAPRGPEVNQQGPAIRPSAFGIDLEPVRHSPDELGQPPRSPRSSPSRRRCSPRRPAEGACRARSGGRCGRGCCRRSRGGCWFPRSGCSARRGPAGGLL
jgi:hypothetical protein